MSHPLSAFDLARARGKEAGSQGDLAQAARWAERAWRLSGRRPLAALELAAVLAKIGDERATDLLVQAAEHHADFPVLIALAASQSRHGARRAAQATLHRLLTTLAVDIVPPVDTLASQIAAWAGLDGWLGWRAGRLLFGTPCSPDTVAFTLDRRPLALDWVMYAPRLWSATLPPAASGRLRATARLLGAPLDPQVFRKPDGLIAQTASRVHGWVGFPRDPARQPGLALALAQSGRGSEIAVPDLALLEPTEADPFARRWGFDLPVPRGASVVGATETGSGHTIALAPASHGPLPRMDATGSHDSLVRQCRTRPCVLLVTHDEGGGIERHVQRRLAGLRRAGKIGLLLRSRRHQPGAVEIADITLRLPSDGPALLTLLRTIAPVRIEFHQPRRHDDLVWQLATSLGLPYDVYLHDYALICPRVTLVGADGTYCGEPPVAACERCIESFEPRHVVAPAGVAALRRRSAALLSQAASVRAPSADAARRFRRHLPTAPISVRPWEPARADPAARMSGLAPEFAPEFAPDFAHVCVVGALNDHKGFGVLLACARDAAIQGLPLRFTVVGHTIDDDALIGAGAFVTGPYLEAERDGLIARQHAKIGFLPSIWPEPWCYALTGLLEAGLPTLCFDIGAQADRVRAAGGSVLPLGLPASRINRHILRLHQLATSRPRAVVA